MDHFTLFYKRLTQLRNKQGISARDMSLSLGQSESYINKIENGKALPSMSAFFYICDFLKIHPRDFSMNLIKILQLLRNLQKNL